MEKIKISSLGALDEVKFKKLADDRNKWLKDGEDMLIDTATPINKLAINLKKDRVFLTIKKIIKENDDVITLVLNSSDGEQVPTFRAGQYITLTMKKNEELITRPFTLSSSPNMTQAGEYKVTLFKDDESGSIFFDKVKVGDRLIGSYPMGDFYYSVVRDQKNVIAIVSGKGICGIYSMAQAIASGIDNYNLTIFYNVKYEKDLIYKKELDSLCNKTSKIKVIYVLSDEEKEGYLTGFVSLDKIKNEMKENNTFFISGSEGMLKYLDNELEELKISNKFIRYESFLPKCNIKKVSEYNLTLYINNEKHLVPCYNNKTIMQAIMDYGVYIPNKCRNGSCGFCSSELVSGSVKVINDKRTEADKKYNLIHPCCTYPVSDIEIIVR